MEQLQQNTQDRRGITPNEAALTHRQRERGRKPDTGCVLHPPRCWRHANFPGAGKLPGQAAQPGSSSVSFQRRGAERPGEFKYFLKTERSAVGFGEADCVGVNLERQALQREVTFKLVFRCLRKFPRPECVHMCACVCVYVNMCVCLHVCM